MADEKLVKENGFFLGCRIRKSGCLDGISKINAYTNFGSR
jgi:hypothetical protein